MIQFSQTRENNRDALVRGMIYLTFTLCGDVYCVNRGCPRGQITHWSKNALLRNLPGGSKRRGAGGGGGQAGQVGQTGKQTLFYNIEIYMYTSYLE